MKFSTIALSIMAAVAIAAPIAQEPTSSEVPVTPNTDDLPKQLQGLPKGVLQNVLFINENEQIFVVEDDHGTRSVLIVDTTLIGSEGLAKREANPEAWRWFWLPGYGEPNWKRDAMPSDVDMEKREANPEAWRWFWLPGYGEPNWKRDAMPSDVDMEKREANPEAWRWFWLPGYGEPNWKRDAMPSDVDMEKREANPEAWRWFWLPGYGEPNW
ncbi:hypothetical protein CJU90_6351 [Yarrowia sp. C11]|nr:hypothetical protein CJU90_6351 [Yarrowia sp. C11]KAG5371053.1 Mating factor alpha [Yarrowia sp. E02]